MPARAMWTAVLVPVLATGCIFSSSEDTTPTPTADSSPAVRVAITSTVAPSATATVTTEPTPPPRSTYVVQPGDNPTTIALTLGVAVAQIDAWVAELLALNNIKATALQVGQELVLPPVGGTGSASATAAETRPGSAPGETSPSPQTGATGPAASSGDPAASPQAPGTTATAVPPTSSSATPPPSDTTVAATAAPTVTTPSGLQSTQAPQPTLTATPPVRPTIPPEDDISDLVECDVFTSQATRDWCASPSGDALDCDDFSVPEEATFFMLVFDPFDINNLDPDGNGNAC